VQLLDNSELLSAPDRGLEHAVLVRHTVDGATVQFKVRVALRMRVAVTRRFFSAKEDMVLPRV